jgi:uncharacterized repeat protein (TIGR03803 family)
MRITPLTHLVVRLAIAAVAVAATTSVSAQEQGTTYEVVSSFNIAFLNGSAPSSLRQANDGTFYGTTRVGGLFGKGTLFRMDATGVVTPLHNFSGANDGGLPFGLVRASDGRFYGITAEGGALGFGTVFRFVPGGVVTTLHEFSETDSRSPVDLFAASDGNVYGLTRGGGDFDNGTIFVIDPGGSFTTIHSIPLSAGRAMASLVKGSDGRFYGTAEQGGDLLGGTLFAIDGDGTLTILHAFAVGFFFAGRDGQQPVGLIQGRDGRLYGTTRFGGEFSHGTLYSIDLAGNYSVLHSFSGTTDGGRPETDLVEASDGNFYGVTAFAGKVFRVDPTGTVTPLHVLPDSSPGDLIQGADGLLYGTTGCCDGGTIFTVDLQATTLATLHQFRVGESVGIPNGVIQARNGQFYGTTAGGGAAAAFPLEPMGTIFAMDAAGARTTLHTFYRCPGCGRYDGTPMSNLFEGADGSLYGTTFNRADTVTGPGQIFRISPAGDFTTLSSRAHWMRAGVIQARDGRLYGTESGGFVNAFFHSYGSVFRVEANGTLTALHQFDGTDSAFPVAELVEIDDGSLYGTSEGGFFLFPDPPGPIPGAIFRFDPATGSFAIRYRFSGPDGSRPTGRLIQGTDGLIYGTTSAGGTYGFGTVFSLDPAGTLTTLHHFAGFDGGNPNAGVIQGLDGRLYGTTTSGGAFGYGTVFVMNVTGGLTTLHHFALNDGANPVNELIQASDGAFYGATPAGGPTGGGVIFRLRLATSPPDGYVEIVSRNSGKCLDVSGASTDAGASAIQWICHGGLNQQWRLEPAGGGAFRIIARHSGQALDVFGALVDDVTPIIQWPVHGGDNQAWTLEPSSDGYVRIVARHSGKALDVEFASPDDGARVIQYTPHGNSNQQWLLRAVGATAAPVTTLSER